MTPLPPGRRQTPDLQILLVDDNESFGTIWTNVLRNAGYGVSFASDYQTALEILESETQIDLLLTDIVMPGQVNGLALARMARLRRPALKVVYTTGYDIPGVDREALGVVLRKPIENETLLDEVGRAFAS